MVPLDLIAAAFLFAVGVFIPIVCIRSHAALSRGGPVPARRSIHAGTLVSLSILAAFALWTAHRVGILLFPVPRIDATLAAITAAAVVTLWAIGFVRWKRRMGSPDSRRRLLAILPRTPGDYGVWVVLSLAAGVGEEIVYRGVLFSILQYLTSSWLTAALLTAVAFGLAHAIQGWGSVAITLIMSLLAQWLVLRAGDLYLAMAAHFTYDVGAGILYAAMARRAGLLVDPVPD